MVLERAWKIVFGDFKVWKGHLMFFKYQKYFWHSNILAWYLLVQYYFVLYSVAKLTIHIFRYPIYVPICISACSILHLSFSLSFYLLYFFFHHMFINIFGSKNNKLYIRTRYFVIIDRYNAIKSKAGVYVFLKYYPALIKYCKIFIFI